MAEESTTASARAMLAGSRGRRLCLEYAMAVSSDIRHVVFWFRYRTEPGHTILFTDTGETGPPEPPEYTPTDLVALLDSLDVAHPNEQAVRAALMASVDFARYWQEPDGEDSVAALPQLRAVLTRIAAAVLSSQTASEWNSARSVAQWAVEWEPADPSPLPSDAATLLAEWNQAQREDETRAAHERPRDPRANWSGTWWSVPQRLLTTRGRVADALELVEDSLGWEVATVIPVHGDGRVLEIRSADDWAELCRAYPFEVTASRRHDWFRVTGRDGRWLIPDWSRVAREWDAVHLSTLAYLCAAATLIEIDAEYATVIGGWAPDATVWLTDAAQEWEQPRQHWARTREGDEWVRLEADV